MLKLALFISGGGTTAAAVITACRQKALKMIPVLVIGSRAGLGGLDKAYSLGIKTKNIVVVNPRQFKNTAAFGLRLISECRKRKVNIIGQFGWLPLTPANLIKEYQSRIINQHPGPLDPPRADFGGQGMYGRRVHAAVLYFRRKTRRDFWTEATVHLVNSEFDKGPVIGRLKIPISQIDTVESLQSKVLPLEHRLQLQVLDLFINNKIKVLKRDQPLIGKKHLSILNQAKEISAYLYPSG